MLLDWLPSWMDERQLGSGPITAVRPLQGGTQNVLISFCRGGLEYVLRRPPTVKRAGSDDAMRREARVLGALNATAVPHPRLIAAEPDESVAGDAFYLMEAIDGFVAPSGWPAGFAESPARLRRVGLSAAESLARLGTVDYQAVGLADLGRPGDFLERQVGRWRWQLDSYGAGLAQSTLPPDLVNRITGWLEQHRPPTGAPGILHGDYHLGNLMLSHVTGDVAAIVDWELVTIGDPLLDLAHFLICWPGPEGEGPFAEMLPIAPTAGLVTETEIVEHYVRHSDRSVEDLQWYKVLAAFRLGVILEGTNVRAANGEAPRHIGEQLHRVAVGLLDRAHREVVAA